MIKNILYILTILINMSSYAQSIHIIGHRGARGLYPENTIVGFQKALDVGATMLELDVVLSKDKQVVVSHDPYMSHEFCLKPNGDSITADEEQNFNIYQMNYAQVLQFDCGLKINPSFPQQQKIAAVKPLLSDVFIAVKNYEREKGVGNINIIVELKSRPDYDYKFNPPPKELSDMVYKIVDQYRSPQNTIILSFDERVLKYWHETYPKYPLAIASDGKELLQNLIYRLGFMPRYYGPRSCYVDKELLQQLHAMSVMVVPWGAQDNKELHRLVDLGVDGIVTDYPNELKRIFYE
jgi:glycerophosphoryl diester phosphodiesterase